MTKVKMLYYNNLICGFEMEGHAEYNTSGPDILCASLSAASQMTINGILDATGFEYDDVVKECNARKGTLKLELNGSEINNGLAMDVVVQQLFKSFELYVVMLEEEYPQNVSIERREEDGAD